MFEGSSCTEEYVEFAPSVEAVLEGGTVLVWKLPRHISQSRLGDRVTGSNACTIIALKMAEAVLNEDLFFPSVTNPQLSTLGLRGRTGIIEYHRAAAGSSHAPTPLTLTLDKKHNGALGDYCLEETQKILNNSNSHSGLILGESGSAHASLYEEDKGGLLPKVSPSIVNALANSIVDGNELHEWAVKELKRGKGELNFTIPDAIGACKNIFRELDFKTVKGPMQKALATHMKRAVAYWEKEKEKEASHQHHLFLLVIAHERTILITYQPLQKVMAVVDSHSHGKQEGAFLASAPFEHVDLFAKWIIVNIYPETYHKKEVEQEFEISLIRYDSQASISAGYKLATGLHVGPTSPYSRCSPVYKSPYATRSQAALAAQTSAGFALTCGTEAQPATTEYNEEDSPRKYKLTPSSKTHTPSFHLSPRRQSLSPPKKAPSPEKKGKVFQSGSLGSTRRQLKRQFEFQPIAEGWTGVHAHTPPSAPQGTTDREVGETKEKGSKTPFPPHRHTPLATHTATLTGQHAQHTDNTLYPSFQLEASDSNTSTSSCHWELRSRSPQKAMKKQ